MEQLLLDIRYALRGLRRDATFTAVALLTLACGIGANTAMFSVVDSVLLQPLAIPAPDDVVGLTATAAGSNAPRNSAAYLDIRDWRDQTKMFEAIAAYRISDASMRISGGAERVSTIRAMGGIFPILGLRPVIGRVFDRDAEIAGHEHVAVISDGMWRTRWGGRPDILGQSLALDDSPFEVIGVVSLQGLPREAISQNGLPDLWVPLVATPAEQSRGNQFLRALGRIKHGVSPQAAAADLNSINARVEKDFPQFHKGWKLMATPLRELIVGNVRPALIVLLCAVGCVLLMACVNIANLLLARTVRRRGEFAVRAALGASTRRLARQLATESLTVSVAGGAMGLGLAYLLQTTLAKTLQAIVPRAADVHISGRVLVFTVLISIAAGLAFGITPALQVRSVSLTGSLGQRNSSSSRTATHMLRALVISQTALALVLLLSSVFMDRSLMSLSATSPGFVADRVMASQVDLAQSRYRTPDKHAEFYRQALEKVRGESGIESAAAITRLPMMGGTQATSFQTEDHPQPPQEWPEADTRIVSPGYFRTLQIPLLYGRDFSENDRAETPPVMVVNREAAERLWPGESAIGKRIQIYPEKGFRSVVGVVGGVRLQRLDAPSVPTLYIPYEQNPFPGAARSSYIVVRTSMAPATTFGVLKRALAGIDDGQAIGPLRLLSDAVAGSVALRRFSTILTTAFALLATGLSLVGTYGVMSFSVSARKMEIGIRAALGASRPSLLWWVLRQGLILAGIGTVLGLALAAASARLVNQMLYGTKMSDPALYAGVTVILLAACTAACYFPAQRAAGVEPTVTMRQS